MLSAGLRAGTMGGIAFSVFALCSSAAFGVSAGWGVVFGLATCCVLLVGFLGLGGWAADLGGTAIATAGEAMGAGAIAGGLAGIIAGIGNFVSVVLAFLIFGARSLGAFRDQPDASASIGIALVWGCLWLVALPVLGGLLAAIGGALYKAIRSSSGAVLT